MSGAAGETVARTNEFEVRIAPRDPFALITLRGRYTDELLGVLLKQVFSLKKGLAIDASALSGVTMALARAIYTASNQLRAADLGLALLNPPDSLRGFLKLMAGDHGVPILLSETQLPPKVKELRAAAEKVERDLQQVRKELESNAVWQFTDRESCWLCPFCGEMCDQVRVGSRVSISQPALEKVWRHLNFDCRAYSPTKPRFKGRDELEAKIRQVNQAKMSASKDRADELQSKVTKLEEKAQWAANMEKGVRIAASRQRKLLPTRPPQIAGCDIAFTYRPAEELSGDFFDFVELEDGRVAFVIGDVSGHGIEAGILMGMTKKVLSIRLRETKDPVAAMAKANADIMPDLDRSSFVTAAAVMFDPRSRSITYARAGHNPPLVFNPAGGLRKLETGGLMLGMAAPATFDAQNLGEVNAVLPGDILLLYTDGLEEGKNASGEEFGLARMAEVLKAEGAKPASYVLGALFYEYDRFAGAVTQEDDLTAVCVKFG